MVRPQRVAILGYSMGPYGGEILSSSDAANSFLHFLGGIDYTDSEDLQSKIKIGMMVKPVWAEKRTGDIPDIAYFTPA